MKTAISAPVIWLVLATLAVPAAAQFDTSRRPGLGETSRAIEVIEARKPQGLWPATKGVRLAMAAPRTNWTTVKSPEDQCSSKPADIITETEHHH